MTSFLSSVDGDVTIREGATVESFRSSTQTRLVVDQVVLRPNGTRTTRPLLRTIADFDVNPTRHGAGPGLGPRHEATANPPSGSSRTATTRWASPTRNGPMAAGASGSGSRSTSSTPKDKSPKTLRLDEIGESNTAIPFGSSNFELTLLRAPARMRDALIRTTAPAGGPAGSW